MRVLFIVGSCLEINSSANLCHLAYIRGFCDAGYVVDVLSARDDGAVKDPDMRLPAAVKHHYQYSVSLYERVSHIRKKATGAQAQTAPVNADPDGSAGGFGSRVKNKIRGLYGVYGIDGAWLSHVKKFRTETYYDVVISLSCPFTSHRAALELIRSGRIDCGRWIQIWEDPWYGDLAYDFRSEACLAEEKKLCAAAREIVYVSPVTLMYQKKLFPESAGKMRFVPTPSYYSGADASAPQTGIFGYFGDYEPDVRDLAPFYEAAQEEGIRALICGNSSRPFASTENVAVHPRMPLGKLAEYERKTQTLVFLCNKKGGQIPGKIFQYSAQNKPILFILDGTAEEIEAIGAYFSGFGRYVFTENNKEDIRKAIRLIQGGNAPSSAIDAFSAQKTVQRILSL